MFSFEQIAEILHARFSHAYGWLFVWKICLLPTR